jgi:hypothetical protein
VGVAAAVNPDAFSSLAGAPQSQINIGKSIFYNERINTTGSGISASFLRHGRLSITRIAGDVISVNGAGPAVIRSQTMADVNATQGAVAGKGWKKTASRTGKKNGWPYYYGIQPTGRYPDQPDIRGLYYDGATTGILLNGLTRVPTPQITPNNYNR